MRCPCSNYLFIGNGNVFLMFFGAVKVFPNMQRLEVIHVLIDELRNPNLRQVPVRFVPNQPHREDVAQRSCNEVRILANQQF